ncbi:MAG: hydroxymethylglutaryl-CoA reductase, partial [Akkermansiaceae bacterium]|nr:hydroxymethylglutaryl-CoA reductase [Akkermansiaceae bacterium]
MNRGARVSVQAGGITACVQDERMTRSLLLEAPSATAAVEAVAAVKARQQEVAERAEGT